jgi:hypothetical protein
MVLRHGADSEILRSYEEERRPIAKDIIATSGKLVRTTKNAPEGSHARCYVDVVKKQAGTITGMGIRYGDSGARGTRMHDFVISRGITSLRLYTLLDYSRFTLLIFSDAKDSVQTPDFIRVIQIFSKPFEGEYWSDKQLYREMAILIRPDSYIEDEIPLDHLRSFNWSTVSSLASLTQKFPENSDVPNLPT